MAFCSMFSVETGRDTGMSFCWSTSQRYIITSRVVDFWGGVGAVFCTVGGLDETDGDCVEKPLMGHAMQAIQVGYAQAHTRARA